MYDFLCQKSYFQGFKSGLNVIEQKQMSLQINPLVKILLVLAFGAIWQPMFMPLVGKSQMQISRI